MAQQQNAVNDAAQAIAQAVTETLNRSIAATGVVATVPSRLDGNVRERISSLQSPRLGSPLTLPNRTPGTLPTSSRMVSETANGSGGHNTIGGTKRRFPPPTLFSRKRAKPASNNTKVISYVRDIVCLPKDYCRKDKVVIPRGDKRTVLAENGLIGKVQFHSGMSAAEVRMEICAVFAKPMGLQSLEMSDGENIFPFNYLQRTGAGSRSLCRPSTSGKFEWSGKQVASLAKSGSFIYILAGRDLPGLYLAVVSL